MDTARHADAKRAREVCAGIQAGEIVLFDNAYIDFSHLADLSLRQIFWGTRAKDNMKFKVVRSYLAGVQNSVSFILAAVLATILSRSYSPGPLEDHAQVFRMLEAGEFGNVF